MKPRDRLDAAKLAYLELDAEDRFTIRRAIDALVVGVARRRPGAKTQLGELAALEIVHALGLLLNRDVDSAGAVCYSEDRGEHGS